MSNHRYEINENGTKVTVQQTDEGLKVWDHETATEIGTAQTEEDARNMING